MTLSRSFNDKTNGSAKLNSVHPNPYFFSNTGKNPMKRMSTDRHVLKIYASRFAIYVS